MKTKSFRTFAEERLSPEELEDLYGEPYISCCLCEANIASSKVILAKGEKLEKQDIMCRNCSEKEFGVDMTDFLADLFFDEKGAKKE